MHLAYVDETYDKGFYWMVGLVCPDEQLQPLTQNLDAVVENAADSYPVLETAELHGYDVLHGEGDWSRMKPQIRARIGVYGETIDAIADSGARVFIRGVNIARLHRRYRWPDHPHAITLQHLLERIDEWATIRNELVLVIADEVDLAAEYRRDLWKFQRGATGGYRSRQITRIDDTLHFVPSQASRLVQAADMVAYLHYRRTTDGARDPRAQRANDNLWSRIDGSVVHLLCWDP